MNHIDKNGNGGNTGSIGSVRNIGYSGAYLSDEELERLIAATEQEPMLHPPREFKNDIIRQIHQKRKRAKNFQLFSYSVKVFAATAAAITIMLTVPESIRSEDTVRERMEQESRGQEAWGTAQERQEKEEQIYNGDFMYRLNERMDDYCSQFNNRLNHLVGMEDF